MFLIVIGVTIFVVWFYILFVREWMVAKWPDQVGWWHTIEDNLWAESRTILGARLYWVGGAIIALHDLAAAAGVDWTPILTQLTTLIPEQYRGLALAAAIAITGLLFEYLRRQTTTSIGEKT